MRDEAEKQACVDRKDGVRMSNSMENAFPQLVLRIRVHLYQHDLETQGIMEGDPDIFVIKVLTSCYFCWAEMMYAYMDVERGKLL